MLGTAKGDIHEIGKTLVGTLLGANGFRVHDLGVDVPPEKFAAAAHELRADVVGVSALLTTTMKGQKNVDRTVRSRGTAAAGQGDHRRCAGDAAVGGGDPG